jgi:hypothetical protein
MTRQSKSDGSLLARGRIPDAMSDIAPERRRLGWMATALGAALMMAGGTVFLLSVL